MREVRECCVHSMTGAEREGLRMLRQGQAGSALVEYTCLQEIVSAVGLMR